MGTIIIYYYSEVNTESEIHFDTNDFDTFDTVSEMSFEWIKNFVREIEYQRNNGKKEYNNGKGCEHQNDDCGRC